MTREEFNEQSLIDRIENRINAEYRKHKNLDWAKIAAIKIAHEILSTYGSSLPPAEGAEAFIRAKIANHKLHECYPTFIPELAQVMTEFAAQPQPTADGAEEIFQKHRNEPYGIFRAMEEYATLHAQRLAEKMVEERLREELIKFCHKCVPAELIGDEIIAVDEYFKTREP